MKSMNDGMPFMRIVRRAGWISPVLLVMLTVLMGQGCPPSGPAGGDLTGLYPNPLIAPNTVTSADIPDGQVMTTDLADSSVDHNKLAFDSLSLTKVSAGIANADSGNIGIGTSTPLALLHLASENQVSERMRMSGQEFFQPSHTSTDGVSFLLGVNRTNNRQLWIADSASLAINATNPTLRLIPNLFGAAEIDALATDGTTPLNLVMQLGGGRLGVGAYPPECKLHVLNASAGAIGVTPNTVIAAENNTHCYVNLLAPDIAESGLLFGRPAGSIPTAMAGIVYNNPGDPDGLQLRTGGNATRMVITNNGLVGIGTAFPSSQLHVVAPGFNGILVQGNGTGDTRVQLFNNGGSHYLFDSLADAHALKLESAPGTNMAFNTNGPNERMRILSTGNVGIGTNTPQNKLDVEGAVAIGATFSGTSAAPTNGLIVEGNVGIGTAIPAVALDISPPLSGLVGTAVLHLYASEISDLFDGILHIRSGGNIVSFDGSDKVGIGTINPSEALTVCGNIRTVGNISASGTITAAVAGACPDFVFDDDYPLMSPEELRDYLACNKHLPHMASAAEVQANGIDLGASQMNLLQTTEELTRYVLDEHVVIQAQKAEIESLKTQLQSLKDTNDRLARVEALLAAQVATPHKP